MKFPKGVHYLAMVRQTPSGLPPIFRVTVDEHNHVHGEVFSVQDDDWVFSSEIQKLRVDMSDEDWVRITPELAREAIEKDRAWYRERQAADRGSGDPS